MKAQVHIVELETEYGIITYIKDFAPISDFILSKSDACPLFMPPIKCTA
jgi:hypothetical protein